MIKNKLKRLEHLPMRKVEEYSACASIHFMFRELLLLSKSQNVLLLIVLVRNQKGAKAKINATRNCFWDSYWGRAGQL